MNINEIAIGDRAPDEVNVVIEIPSRAEAVKYEMDKASGALIVDRFLSTAMRYPCNYGFVPHTLSEDDDPADVLVITPYPLLAGSVIAVRLIGMLQMTDEAGRDVKLLAVPIEKLCQEYQDVQAPSDLPKTLLDRISHFFERYKDLEAHKWVKIEGWVDAAAARAEMQACIDRFSETE